jgi:hypothetical protein
MKYEFDFVAEDVETIGEFFLELIEAEIPFSVYVASQSPVI